MRDELSEALRAPYPRRYVVAVFRWAGGWDLERHARDRLSTAEADALTRRALTEEDEHAGA